MLCTIGVCLIWSQCTNFSYVCLQYDVCLMWSSIVIFVMCVCSIEVVVALFYDGSFLVEPYTPYCGGFRVEHPIDIYQFGYWNLFG